MIIDRKKLGSTLLYLAVVGHLACGGNTSGQDSNDAGSMADAPSQTNAKTMVSGVVRALGSDEGMAGVTVSTPDGQSVTSDINGFYSIAIESSSKVALKFHTDNFAPTYERVHGLIGGDKLTQDAILAPVGATEMFDTSVGGTISLLNGAKVEFPADAFVRGNGSAYTGMTEVSLTHVDPLNREQIEAFPGSFEATRFNGDEAMLISYSLADVTATDTNGALLQIAPKSAATLVLPLSNPESAPETIGLWSLDPMTGIWVEEGTATKQVVDDHSVYVAEVTHLSWWNADASGRVARLAVSYQIDGSSATAAEVATQFPNAKLKGFNNVNASLFDLSVKSADGATIWASRETTMWIDAGAKRSQVVRVSPTLGSTVEIVFDIIDLPTAEIPPDNSQDCQVGQRYCHGECLDMSLTCGTVTPAEYCSVNQGGCVAPAGDCSMNQGIRSCDCQSGYYNFIGTCQDVNECTSFSSDCDYLACTNTEGSYECGECPSPFVGDGTKSGSGCSCQPGYYQSFFDCYDVDECADNTSDCVAQACTNTEGSYECQCAPDQIGDGTLSGNGCFLCSDLQGRDECNAFPSCTWDEDSSTCDTPVNFCASLNSEEACTAGAAASCDWNGASCILGCNDGYTLINNICQDVDECADNTSDCVAQTCTNTEGSYECQCAPDQIGDGTLSGSGCFQCGDLLSSGDCDEFALFCNWDESSSLCKSSSDSCTSLQAEFECTAVGCDWDGANCHAICFELGSMSDCENQAECSWSEFTLDCNPDCTAQTDIGPCENAGCIWNGFGCESFF